MHGRPFALSLSSALLALSLAGTDAQAQQATPSPTPPRGTAAQAAATPAPIGYVELEDDERYELTNAFANIDWRTFGRPYPGAVTAIQEAQQTGRLIRLDFSLNKFTGAKAADIADTIRKWLAEKNIHFVVTDLPAGVLVDVAKAVKDLPITLLNISAPDDNLRARDCQANVLHIVPSYAMLNDGLAQYLVFKKWTNVLVLQGPAAEDERQVKAFQASAKKFGVRVVETLPFLLSNDPRNRTETNVALMTAGKNYDVVYVADSSNEFGRFVAYKTSLPRPIVGTSGLIPQVWHWTWDKDDAAQLQHRFEKNAMPRQMNGIDFSAWVAVRSLYITMFRLKSPEYEPVKAQMTSEQAHLDSLKGKPMTFRPWDGQLRQQILLHTPDAVIAQAPFPQFLHQTNDLDTLGVDKPETQCRF
ncbi:MAG: amino acid ABC transporter substrate-binding protein [Bauldia sp.]